jgi:hypothetical protein
VWQKSDERFILHYVTPTFKLGHTSVMICEAFPATYKLPLIVMPLGRHTVVNFIQIIYDGILGPFLDAQEDSYKLVLMEDGPPIHRVKVRQESCKIEKIV